MKEDNVQFFSCFCGHYFVGMQKLVNFSEGVRESLRRLSGITWMAEELLKVAVYFCPNKLVILLHASLLHNFTFINTFSLFYKNMHQLYAPVGLPSLSFFPISTTLICHGNIDKCVLFQ